MKLLAILNTGNDEDIVEMNIRHNMKHFYKMVIIDNNSSDRTRDILTRLKDEFKDRLILTFLDTSSLSLYSFANNKIRKLYRREADYIFVIDADEFLVVKDIEELNSIPSNTVGFISWRVYVPNKTDHINYLSEMTYRRDREPEGCHKMAIPKNTDGRITIGNHYMHDSSEARVNGVMMNKIWLAHYPVRTIKQINKKITFMSALFASQDKSQCYQTRDCPKIETMEALFDKALTYADITGEKFDLIYEPVGVLL